MEIGLGKTRKKSPWNWQIKFQGLVRGGTPLEDAKGFICIFLYISETNCVNPDL